MAALLTWLNLTFALRDEHNPTEFSLFGIYNALMAGISRLFYRALGLYA